MSEPWPIRKARRVFERARRLVNHARGRAHRWLEPGPASYRKETGLRIRTDHPVAYESHDHQAPHGTANDNTHYPWFVAKTQRVFGRKVRHMDLGCSGGGLVKDFLDAKHFSVGVEGSDYSRKKQRAEWKTIPGNLFTADITKPFFIYDESTGAQQRILFDLISAWEVMEHIQERDLSGLFANIRDSLVPGGLFVCSIAQFPDGDYHVTLQPKAWWERKFSEAGLTPVEGVYVDGDYVRESSFYITARKS
jgi:2-polyprenyl-3-methyl-5-hydroxy-6-metoxy-1,4-benzoquinol methylase